MNNSVKISIAKTAGFCMGVQRAVEMVLDAPKKHQEPIYTFGPLIHNPQVLTLLEEKGITSFCEVPPNGKGTVLIRAHGVPPQTKVKLKAVGFKVIDATCPRVIKVQSIIRKHAQQDYASVIVGDRNHPEVVGLLGYAGDKGYVVGNRYDLDHLPSFDQAIVVAQTTQSIQFFDEVTRKIREKYPHYKIFNTICDSTSKRQNEVRTLAATADTLVVVGGKNSGNTKRLVEIGKQTGTRIYHVESEADIRSLPLESAGNIGIIAGASTPNWVISKVVRTIEKIHVKRGQSLRKIIYIIQRGLLLTNIYVALGAGFLCFTCTILMGIYPYQLHVTIAMLYVLSMHILNNLIGSKADRYNDPDRVIFYRKYRIFLGLLAVVAGGYGLFTAKIMGWGPFLVLFLMTILGLSYNFTLIPPRFGVGRYRRIRDISGSKTVLIALAWGIVTSLLPVLSATGTISITSVLVFIWSYCFVFSRTAFFDILDMQGDRIIGKNTIPLMFGEKRTIKFLHALLTATFCMIILAVAWQLVPKLGLPLAICPLLLYITFSAHEAGYMLPGIRLEFIVESHFILAGVITLIWLALTG